MAAGNAVEASRLTNTPYNGKSAYSNNGGEIMLEIKMNSVGIFTLFSTWFGWFCTFTRVMDSYANCLSKIW